MSSIKKDKKQQVQVFVRVRPLNKQEGISNIVDIKNGKELFVKYHSSTKCYNYDKIFGPDSRQMEVYKMVAEPMVKEVLAGYNCTVLAYGQTGTGKTYTMVGGQDIESTHASTKPPWFEDEYSGIIPRTLAHMFDELRIHQLEYTVRVSYLELYNEELFDLLSPCEDIVKLKLYDDVMKKGSVIVHNLTEVTVNSKSEVFSILEKGAYKRKMAPTLMNAQSSRSHTVFCITVHTKETSVDSEDLLKTGKLYLVDLAGSENIKQSGATEMRAREAVSINQSLLTLGRCIAKLFERSAHIPYRESKLTRLLQDSLGGRTKTTLIATVSPAHCNCDETVNTLEYASRAKNITNKPEINQKKSKTVLLREYTEEIERLRKDLLATRFGKGIYIDEDNYSTLMNERSTQKEEIAEKIAMIRMMQDQMADKEHLCQQLQVSLQEHQKEVELKVDTISILTNQLEEASKTIDALQQETELKEFIVEKYAETEQQLKLTAHELLNVAETTTYDTRKLHDKLEILTELNSQNKELYEIQISEFNSKMNEINNKLKVFDENEVIFHQSLNCILLNFEQITSKYKNNSMEMIARLNSVINDINQFGTETNFASESIKTTVEAAQSNILQLIIDIKTSFQNKITMSVTPHITNLYTCIQQQDDFVEKIMLDSRKRLEQTHEQVTEFIAKCKNLILQTNVATSKQIKEHMKLYKEMQQEIIKKHEYKILRRKALEEQYNIANHAVQEIKRLLDEDDTECVLNKETSLQNMNSLKENLVQYEQDAKSITGKSMGICDNFIDNFHLLAVKVKSDLKSEEIEKKSINFDMKTSKSNVNEVLEECSNYTQESFLKIGHNTEEQIQQIGNLITKQLNEQITTIDRAGEKLNSFYNETNCNINKIIKDVNDECIDLNDNALLKKKTCEEISSIIKNDLQVCREGFYELRSNSLKEYKITGETPRRKSYRYPRMLTETKPRDKLLEEYCRMRSTSTSCVSDNIPEEGHVLTRSLSETNISKENNESREETEGRELKRSSPEKKACNVESEMHVESIASDTSVLIKPLKK